MTLVSCDSMCQPKPNGGLRLRHLNEHNSSFMMKVGFNFVSNSKALWVGVLRWKYGVQKGLLKTLSRGNCYFLWRSLSMIWALLRKNLIWSVEDGSCINCWQDPWILNY
ncbi:hypothetical protein V6Z11_D02G129100 [Gossypium hirsutum]